MQEVQEVQKVKEVSGLQDVKEVQEEEEEDEEVTLCPLRSQDREAGGREEEEVQVRDTTSW